MSEHAFIRPGQVAPDLPAPDNCVRCGQPEAAHPSAGPFDTEGQARDLPAVRAVYAAFDRDHGTGKMAPHSYLMLISACEAAGVEMGAYDKRILAWLAGYEPQTCAVICGLISRAAEAAGKPARGRHAAASSWVDPTGQVTLTHEDLLLALGAIRTALDVAPLAERYELAALKYRLGGDA